MDYNKIYSNIIEKAKSENRIKKMGIYYESHHITPKCLGGNNLKSNLVLLTAKEHYICHYLLTFIYPNNNSLFFAFWNMINRESDNQLRFKVSAKTYEKTRELISIIRSEKWKIDNPNDYRDSSGKNNPMYGSSRTGEQNPFYGKCHSNETKLKISLANKGRTGFHNIRAVIIEGVEYPTLTEASLLLDISISLIHYRLKSTNEKYNNYKYKL